MTGAQQNRFSGRHSSSVPNNRDLTWEQKYKAAESERKKAVKDRDAAKKLKEAADKQIEAKQARIVAVEKERDVIKEAVEKERDAIKEEITAAENAKKVADALHEDEIKEKNETIEKLKADLRDLTARTTSACEHVAALSICVRCNQK